jgi:hypothetical protein
LAGTLKVKRLESQILGNLIVKFETSGLE